MLPGPDRAPHIHHGYPSASTDARTPGGHSQASRPAEALRARAAQYAAAHPPKPATPPPDPGRVLATAPRPDGTELRVSWHLFEGKPYLRVAPWQRGTDGAWWPVKGRGCTVKVRELGVLAEGIALAMDAAEGAL